MGKPQLFTCIIIFGIYTAAGFHIFRIYPLQIHEAKLFPYKTARNPRNIDPLGPNAYDPMVYTCTRQVYTISAFNLYTEWLQMASIADCR